MADPVILPQNIKSRGLRACTLCSIVLGGQDFKRSGCPNCEEIMNMAGSEDRVMECTTTIFDGVIAVINPDESWVARWQRTAKYKRGMYAARVKARIPEDVEAELETRGIPYRPRDDTSMD
ncbi:Spt4/RpoE2 zinc finger-domain-containing protein [Flagelloscypha sp. PMI_526]|nr:Spt4/RpoE2 zinc finger-domain-containing protein [Flagelloscypha sp. PMI_526]